jgi:choline-sulfatase
MRLTFLISVAVLVLSNQLASAVPPARKSPPNVVLVTIDTVRADHVGCYSARGVVTTTLDSLAHDGVVFDDAISQVPLTWPSHTVILTGLYPFQNGVQDFTGRSLESRFRTVAQAFKANGYATGAVVSSFVLDQSFGLARGFDHYDDAFSPKAYKERDLGIVERRAEESVTHALDWLNRTPRRRPFFLWLHLYDPHSPYDPPEPYHTDYHDKLYDGEIAYADHELGRLVSWLKRKQLYAGSLIVVLSDHGESLGEHGEKEHGFFIYNSTTRIPLIVKPPAGSGIRPGRITQPVETTEVAPTLLRLAGLSDPIQKQFQSPPLFDSGNKTNELSYSETFYPFNSFGWSPLHSVQTGRYHYIDAPKPELYDLAADPGEKNNLAAQQPATMEVLKSKLQALMRDRPFTPDAKAGASLPPETAEKLRALGYVAYHSPVTAETLAGNLPDPKDKIEEFQTILQAEDALHAGDFAAGEAQLQKIQEKDPKLYIVPFYLGESALAQQKYADAVTHFKKSLDLNPNFEQAMTGLTRALVYSQQWDEAKLWAQNTLKLNPENSRAWYALGLVDARTNKKAAIADYEKAISIQPNFAPLHRDLGLIQFQEKNYAEAARHLAKAVELGTSDFLVFNSLGISYSRTNQLKKSVESYKRGLELNPQFAETHVNLAIAYQRLHMDQAAMREYKEACRLDARLCEFVTDER